MKNDLKANVQSWLETQGYPLEMKVARAFREIGAGAGQSIYYIDPEESKPREIDIVASWYKMHELEESAELQVFFFISCKSQQKEPWVIFSGGQKREKPFRRFSLNFPTT